MSRTIRLALAAAALTPIAAGPAAAQQANAPASQYGGLAGLLGQGATGSGNGLSGLSGLSGLGLPSLGSSGMGNVAGLLGYCLKNRLLGANTVAGTAAPGTDATAATSPAATVLSQLTGQRNATSAPGYAAGQAGQIQAGGQTLSLDSLKGQVKTKVCDMVLQRATSFLPR